MDRAELTPDKLKEIIKLIVTQDLGVLITDSGHIAYEIPVKIKGFNIHANPLDMEKEVIIIILNNSTRCKVSSSTGFKLNLEVSNKFFDLIIDGINSPSNFFDKIVITALFEKNEIKKKVLKIAKGE